MFLSILVIFLLLSTFIFVRKYWGNSDYTAVIKENFIKFTAIAEDKYIKFTTSTREIYIKTFEKDIYYSGMGVVEVNGKKISRDIIINIDNPKADRVISKIIDLTGWAIETNSIYNTGIDRIEFFFDGKPGKGKYLGQFSQNYEAELQSKDYIVNLYNNFYNRQPTTSELDFWAINLEYDIMSYKEVAANIIDESKFMEKDLSNEDFLSALYGGLLNSDWHGAWADRLETDLTREDLLYIIINSTVFNKLSENYYKIISIKEPDLSIFRIDVGDRYGKQFYLSGFDVYLDSTKVENGKHELYIYAHSPVFGWDYEILSFEIKN
ncbi:MAG: DUF4214 domain-containing protein [Candidatus Humimicrobiaceae bacterium]